MIKQIKHILLLDRNKGIVEQLPLQSENKTKLWRNMCVQHRAHLLKYIWNCTANCTHLTVHRVRTFVYGTRATVALVYQLWQLGKGSVFENGRFGSGFHFWLAVLDFETPTKRFCSAFRNFLKQLENGKPVLKKFENELFWKRFIELYFRFRKKMKTVM